MSPSPTTKYHLIDGLAQRARDGSMTKEEVNLALSILLESALNEIAEKSPEICSGIVSERQEDIETRKIKPKSDGT